jgi:hypothetical protein
MRRICYGICFDYLRWQLKCQRSLQTMVVQQNGQAVAGKNGRQMYA